MGTKKKKSSSTQKSSKELERLKEEIERNEENKKKSVSLLYAFMFVIVLIGLAVVLAAGLDFIVSTGIGDLTMSVASEETASADTILDQIKSSMFLVAALAMMFGIILVHIIDTFSSAFVKAHKKDMDKLEKNKRSVLNPNSKSSKSNNSKVKRGKK